MGIQQMQVTVTGNLGADPVSFGKDLDSPACSFRVGVTPRYFDSQGGMWRDRETSWVGVRAYRTLAVNVLGSLHKGDPVIVTGTLHTERWRKEGVDRITPVVEASAVGCDLSQGTCRFRRAGREQPAAAGADAQANAQASDGAAVGSMGAVAEGAPMASGQPGVVQSADGAGVATVTGSGPMGAAAAGGQAGVASDGVAAPGGAGLAGQASDAAASGTVPAFLTGAAPAPGPTGPAAGAAGEEFDGEEF